MSFLDAELESNYCRLGFVPEDLRLRLKVGRVELSAVQYPLGGVAIFFTGVRRDEAAQFEINLPVVQTKAGFTNGWMGIIGEIRRCPVAPPENLLVSGKISGGQSSFLRPSFRADDYRFAVIREHSGFGHSSMPICRLIGAKVRMQI